MTKRIGMVLAVILTLTAASTAGPHSPRQFFGGWQKHKQHNYHFRTFNYKPHDKFAGYKHHYVINFPHKPGHNYFYNPYTKQYWGRCPTKTDGKPQYSLLAEKDRKGKIDEIPESAFPKPGPLPPIPESDDGATIDLPPDDLPEEPTPVEK